jgi:hypothetical protein
MNRIERVAAVTAVIACSAVPWSAAFSFDATVTGTFTMNSTFGSPGSDLLAVLGHDNGFRMTLYGATALCEDVSDAAAGEFPGKLTALHASSIAFEFLGVDQALLNQSVGQFLRHGRGGTDVGLIVAEFAPFGGQDVFVDATPDDLGDGVLFSIHMVVPPGTFPLDSNGCPIIVPFTMSPSQPTLLDYRAGNDASVYAAGNGTLTLEFPPTAADAASWGRIKALYR